MAFKVDDWTHEGEEVFVDVRAKVNAEKEMMHCLGSLY